MYILHIVQYKQNEFKSYLCKYDAIWKIYLLQTLKELFWASV